MSALSDGRVRVLDRQQNGNADRSDEQREDDQREMQPPEPPPTLLVIDRRDQIIVGQQGEREHDGDFFRRQRKHPRSERSDPSYSRPFLGNSL